MNNLSGKTAVVTGASRGIGQAIAKGLAAEGANLAICARSLSNLEETTKICEALGVKVKGYAVDVADTAAVKDMIDDAKAEFGNIDVLVNNAGVTKDGLLARMTEDDWDFVINTNLRGAFLFSKAAAKHMMKQRHGSIINIASVVGLVGNPGQTNYCASKGGLIAFGKSLAKELATRNVRVNSIAPGFINTAMTEELPEAVKEKLMSGIPMGKFGQPEQVASVVNFLAGDAASYMTGQTLSVCGGMVTA